jgi:small subunit ribosomal protein S20
MVAGVPVADHASALKRHRQTVKRTKRNQALRTRLRHFVRAVRRAVAGKDQATADETLRRATRALDKAVTKGVIHRNNAARRISRLSRAVSQLRAGAGR